MTKPLIISLPKPIAQACGTYRAYQSPNVPYPDWISSDGYGDFGLVLNELAKNFANPQLSIQQWVHNLPNGSRWQQDWRLHEWVTETPDSSREYLTSYNHDIEQILNVFDDKFWQKTWEASTSPPLSVQRGMWIVFAAELGPMLGTAATQLQQLIDSLFQNQPKLLPPNQLETIILQNSKEWQTDLASAASRMIIASRSREKHLVKWASQLPKAEQIRIKKQITQALGEDIANDVFPVPE